MVCEAMHALYALCGTSYYDDFCTVEPTWAAASGQLYLRRFAERLGIPFSDAKHVDMAPTFVFLGVEARLGSFWPEGVVTLGVEDERCCRIADTIDYHLDGGSLFCGESAKICGRLGFSTSWTSGRFGRAAMQPLYRRASSKTLSLIDEGVRNALKFFGSVLRRKGGLPPRKYRLRDDARPTVKIWTDAAWEPDEAVPASVAFVVFFPGEWRKSSGGVRVWRKERYVHGFKAVPPSVMALFYTRKQYIGQLELLAAVAVYYSLPELKGRRVVHCIDNTSAIAALVKGYSGSPDSVRILHAFAAFSLGLDTSSWFLWVPSKANIADLPSRNDFALLEELGSVEVPFLFPPFAAWDQPAADWVDMALARGAEAGVPPPPPDPVRPGLVSLGHARFANPRPGDVRIDRNSSSPLANPFRMRLRGASRMQVIDAFAALLKEPRGDDEAPRRVAARAGLPRGTVSDDPFPKGSQAGRLDAIEALATRVTAGQDVRLLCWCFPCACHGDVVAALVRARARELYAPQRRGKRQR